MTPSPLPMHYPERPLPSAAGRLFGIASLHADPAVHPKVERTSVESERQPCLASVVETGSYPETNNDELERWLDAARSVCYNVSLLARQFDRSPKQLRRDFKARGYGSPKRFLERLRAMLAREALKRGHMAKEAAIEFHYHDPAHLHRALKMHLGVTPSQIIAQRMKGAASLNSPGKVPPAVAQRCWSARHSVRVD